MDAAAWAQIQRAEALLQTNRPEQALEILGAVVASDPGCVEAHLMAARCLLDMGQPYYSLSAADQAAAADPNLVAAQLARSAAFRMMSNWEGARVSAEVALRLSPNSSGAHVSLAYALASMGRTDEGFFHADEAVRLAPNSPVSHISRSFVAIGARQWRECEISARRALELDPDSSAAMNNLGVALRHRMRPLAAIHTFAGAARSNPKGRISQGNVNSTILRLTGWALCVLATMTALLIWLVGSNPQLSRDGLIGTFSVTAVAAVAVTSAWIYWFVRLPRGARNSLRDLEAWKRVFNRRSDTVGGITGRVLWYLLAFFGFPLIFVLELIWAVLRMAGPLGAPGSLLVQPILFLVIAVVLRSGRVRGARRNGRATKIRNPWE